MGHELTPGSTSLAAAVQSGRATPEAVRKALARAQTVGPGHGYVMPSDEVPPPPPPQWRSWADWCTSTTVDQKRTWCTRKAKKANRGRLLAGSAERRVSAHDVWLVLEAAAGRCCYCGSLAVEQRPSGPTGQPIPWAAVGRRIGSLGHKVSRFDGGGNERENLAWTCLWCNTWQSERRSGATDHGGLFPHEPGRTGNWEAPYPPVRQNARKRHAHAGAFRSAADSRASDPARSSATLKVATTGQRLAGV